jgi:FdhD protein
MTDGGETVPPGENQPDPGVVVVPVRRVGGGAAAGSDALAVEEPLEIRLRTHDGRTVSETTVSVTMRTPGHDAELAAGFLYTEGVIAAAGDVAGVTAAGDNVAVVELRPGVAFDRDRLDRHFYTTSSCGVCGKTSIRAVRVAQRHRLPPGPHVDAAVIHRLPAALRAGQAAFDRTGGLHAAALFDERGTLLAVREDVGRHNALDKLIGAGLLSGSRGADATPLAGSIVLVSGRSSFELVQKATLAGVPILAAVGAPSSLAVDLARDRGLTLLGFVRDHRFNIYSGAGRVRAQSDS